MNEVAEVEFQVDKDGTLTVTGLPDAELLAFADAASRGSPGKQAQNGESPDGVTVEALW